MYSHMPTQVRKHREASAAAFKLASESLLASTGNSHMLLKGGGAGEALRADHANVIFLWDFKNLVKGQCIHDMLGSQRDRE